MRRDSQVRERFQTVSEYIADRLRIRRQVVFVSLGVPKQSVLNRVRFQFLLPLDVVIHGHGIIWKEIAGKLASWEKPDTNLQGSWVISKNLTRTCREPSFFQKTWHELAGKLSSFKRKPGSCKNQGAYKVSVVAQLDTASPF